MWKYKNKKELKLIRQKRKRSLKEIWRPFKLAVIYFILAVIVIKIGFNKWSVPVLNPMSWEVFFDEGMLIAFLFGLFVFFMVYLGQIISKNPAFPEPEVMMCLKCEKLKSKDNKNQCDCGGEFVPLDELEWVDEDKNLKNILRYEIHTCIVPSFPWTYLSWLVVI